MEDKLFTPDRCPSCNKPLKNYYTQCPWCGKWVDIEKKTKDKTFKRVRTLVTYGFVALALYYEVYLLLAYKAKIHLIISRAVQSLKLPWSTTGVVDPLFYSQFYYLLAIVALNIIMAHAVFMIHRRI